MLHPELEGLYCNNNNQLASLQYEFFHDILCYTQSWKDFIATIIIKWLLFGMNSFDIFELFVDQQLLLLIVLQTNWYCEQKWENNGPHPRPFYRYEPFTMEDLKAFLGMMIDCHRNKGPIRDIWSKNPHRSYPPSAKVMPRNIFCWIISNLNFADNTNQVGRFIPFWIISI